MIGVRRPPAESVAKMRGSATLPPCYAAHGPSRMRVEAVFQQSSAAGGAPDWRPALSGWPPTEKSVYDRNCIIQAPTGAVT